VLAPVVISNSCIQNLMLSQLLPHLQCFAGWETSLPHYSMVIAQELGLGFRARTSAKILVTRMSR